MTRGITFEFDLEKAISAMVHILHRLGPMDKIKLIKLLYLADRESFLALGYPITGDRQCAMDLGPVPSGCLDALSANIPSDLPFRFVHVSDNRVENRTQTPEPPELPKLLPEEKRVLDDVIDRYGPVPTWKLVNQTHAFPEYREVWVKGTSRTIEYDSLLRFYGTENQFRHNRPVVSPQMAAKMVSPFLRPEPDL